MSTPRPAGDWIIVRRPSPRSASGLYTPSDPDPNAPKKVEVLAVGPGRISEYGVSIIPEATVGEQLLVGNAGIRLEEHDDGSSDWIIKPSEILAHLGPEV